MPLPSRLNEALLLIQAPPLADAELYSLSLFIAEDFPEGVPQEDPDNKTVGTILQRILQHRQKKGLDFSHELLRDLLCQWEVPVSPSLEHPPTSAFFLGTSL